MQPSAIIRPTDSDHPVFPKSGSRSLKSTGLESRPGLWETVRMAKPTRAPNHDDIRAKKLAKQITDKKLRKKRIPKKGDRVGTLGHNGAFVVSHVDSYLGTVELKMIGHDFALSTIPWGALTYIDELDENQNALRVVKEATED
jgi:hypothetical protein